MEHYWKIATVQTTGSPKYFLKKSQNVSTIDFFLLFDRLDSSLNPANAVQAIKGGRF